MSRVSYLRPADQPVTVNNEKPLPCANLWNAIWATGIMTAQLQIASLGEIGHSISSDEIEVHEC